MDSAQHAICARTIALALGFRRRISRDTSPDVGRLLQLPRLLTRLMNTIRVVKEIPHGKNGPKGVTTCKRVGVIQGPQIPGALANTSTYAGEFCTVEHVDEATLAAGACRREREDT